MGAPVRGFTNRQIYNTFGAKTDLNSLAYKALQNIFTKNGTDNKITSSPQYYERWQMVTTGPSDTVVTIVTNNPNEPSPMGIALCESPTANFNDIVVKGYSYSGVLQVTGLTSSQTYFLAVWNAGVGATVQWDYGTYSSKSRVSTPSITISDDGKFSITCATSGADIYWRPSKINGLGVSSFADQSWVLYDPSEDMLPLAPGVTIQAAAAKDGMWDSYVAGDTTEFKLENPEITIGTAPGSKFIELDGGSMEDLIHGLKLKFIVNSGSDQTYQPSVDGPYEVESGDVVEAWAEGPSGSDWTDSDISSHTVS